METIIRPETDVTSIAPHSAARLAIQDITPFLVALVPFSLAIGSASAANGLTLAKAFFGGAVLLAGTAQLAAVELIGSEASIPVAVGTIIVINGRFAIYSAGFARWFSSAPLRQKLWLAFPLVDQSFLCCEERFATMTDLDHRRRYFLTVSALLMSAFLGSQLVGYQLGASVPPWLGLHLAAPLAFAGMLAKAVKGRSSGTAAVVAALAVVAATALPGGLALPIAVVAGVAAGMKMELETS